MKEDSAGEKALKQFADLMIQKSQGSGIRLEETLVLSGKRRRTATEH